MAQSRLGARGVKGRANGLKLKPGQKVVVMVGGYRVVGQLLHPEKPGFPDRAWIVVFGDGMADVFKLEEMGAV